MATSWRYAFDMAIPKPPPIPPNLQRGTPEWNWWYPNVYRVSPWWGYIRRKAIDIQGNRCQNEDCEDPGYPMNVHHERYVDANGRWVLGREHPMYDLTVLCRYCHAAEHGD